MNSSFLSVSSFKSSREFLELKNDVLVWDRLRAAYEVLIRGR